MTPTKTMKEDDEADDDILTDIGFLFEGNERTTLKRFQWRRTSGTGDNNSISSIHVAIHVVDEEPGAVVSGHFLWPASIALCEFLISEQQQQQQQQDITCNEGQHQRLHPKYVLELGSGCALPSLVSLQLFRSTVQGIVITDHDPTVLRKARDNYESTLEDLYERAESKKEQDGVLHYLSSIPVQFESLSWVGKQPESAVSSFLQKFLNSAAAAATATSIPSSETTTIYFDLVLGSDLIDSIEVVEPLLRTAVLAMQPQLPHSPPLVLQQPEETSKAGGGEHHPSRFVLSQSFAYDDDTEHEIELVASNLNLKRIIHLDTLSSSSSLCSTVSNNHGIRIQEFRF